MARGDLTDRQWAQLEPLLPVGKKAGRPRTWTRRQLIDGIRWRTRAGTPWRDVPERYGPWDRIYDLFRRVAARRHLEADPGGTAGPGRRAGSDHVGCERGFDGLPCPPARRRRA
ncbi:transposase [Streptomyces sp. NPDC056323]|uniref:transposase n=1 Tax=unclassified Streptomyces TaxID=2593676 RepID=UPI0035E02FC6